MSKPPVARFQTALSRTQAGIALIPRHRGAIAVFAATSLLYLLVYLYALGHLQTGLGGFGVTAVPGALGKLLQPAPGSFAFEPVALVEIGPISYLFSFNTVLGSGLSALVGLNLGLTYLAWTQPAACGIGSGSSGLFASLPAVLSGTACCGPVILIALGIQASSTLLTAFQFLFPAAVLLLVGSLVLVGRKIRPPALDSTMP